MNPVKDGPPWLIKLIFLYCHTSVLDDVLMFEGNISCWSNRFNYVTGETTKTSHKNVPLEYQNKTKR